MTTIRLAATPRLRRAVLQVSLAAAALELALFVVLWRVLHAADASADPRVALLSIALGTVLTLQAMAIVGLAWLAAAMSRTVLDADGEHVSLEHPWRRWHGPWSDVTGAWVQRGWLALEVRGQWRRWHVRTTGGEPGALSQVRAALAPGVWLEGPALRRHLVRTTLPVVLAATGVAGLLLVGGLWLLERAGPVR